MSIDETKLVGKIIFLLYKRNNTCRRYYPFHILPYYRFLQFRGMEHCFSKNNFPNTIPPHELDSIAIRTCPAVLPSITHISYGSDRITIRSEKAEADRREPDDKEEARGPGEIIMPIFKLGSYESQLIGYKVDSKYRRFRFTVESDEKVTVYLITQEEAMKFKNGESFHSYLKTKEKHYHEDDIKLPYGGNWYLVIYNPSSETAAVSYDVY